MSRNIILNISPGELTWDIGGTPVAMGPLAMGPLVMGPTKGGVIVKSELATVPIMQDGYGGAELDAVTK
jgi:hypothetical protein